MCYTSVSNQQDSSAVVVYGFNRVTEAHMPYYERVTVDVDRPIKPLPPWYWWIGLVLCT